MRPTSPAALAPAALATAALLALSCAVACSRPAPAADGTTPGEATGPAAATDATAGAVAPPATAPVDPAAETAEIESWRAERLARLTSEDGWLTLVGLHWLHSGDQTLGSAAASDVRLPASTPGTLGGLHVEGKTVRLALAPGVAVTSDGKPFPGGALATDADEAPTVLHVGTVTFYPIVRAERVGLRVKDSASPARRGFGGIDNFPVDPAWRVAARLVPYPEPRTLGIPDVTGNTQQIDSPGELVFAHGGETFRLPALDEGGDELSLIFTDATTGHETYGSGRYLEVAKPDADGVTVIDFNRAYNPPCAFTEFATCPLPPKGSRVSTRIEAGEKHAGHPA